MKDNSHKGLAAWQITMLTLGTVIGGSFFLGSAVAIREAGPAIIISYILGGGLVYLILFALAEMTIANPASGSFRTYAEDIFGPMAGFIVGWVYWTGLVLAMSSEAIAVSLLLKNWFPNIPGFLIGIIIIIGITIINLFGVDKLTKLETGLAAIKLTAIIGFILIALLLVSGVFPGKNALGLGEIGRESLFPRGLTGIAGSMLIVMFTYAGFEITGLAAVETEDTVHTIPRTIAYTVISLVGLYLIALLFLLPLVPTSILSEETSPLVTALTRNGLAWAGVIMNIVMISAILSTMLAATFGIGQMLHSLAKEGHAPFWLRDKTDIPYRGIIFSGIAMLVGLGMGYLLPRQIYLFLVSSGGFSFLFVYTIIMITHYQHRKKYGCPPKGKCTLPGFPYTSWIAIIGLIAIIASMPLIAGQGTGLAAGLLLISFYFITYLITKKYKSFIFDLAPQLLFNKKPQTDLEVSDEFITKKKNKNINKLKQNNKQNIKPDDKDNNNK